ncbi:MAG: hypothetical protein PHH77_11000 [Victivallaceae bacterium]|nr:hypothetical protein [Victivallaceae bacterium]
MKKNEKRRMQRLGDPTAENVGRSSPMSESIARQAALGQYRSRKAIFSKKERSGFLKMLSVRAEFKRITLLFATSLSRRKIELLTVAVYTILAVDKKAATK